MSMEKQASHFHDLDDEWLATLEEVDNWMVFETSYAQADYLHCGVLQTMVQWSSSMRVKLVALH